MIGTGSPSYFCRAHRVSTGWNAGVGFQPQPALALGVAAIGFAFSLTMLAAGIPTTTWERWCLGHCSCMGNITAFRVPIWPSKHLDHNHEWTSIWTHHVNINCVVCEYRCFHSLTRTKGGSAASRHVSNELLMNFLGAQTRWALKCCPHRARVSIQFQKRQPAPLCRCRRRRTGRASSATWPGRSQKS